MTIAVNGTGSAGSSKTAGTTVAVNTAVVCAVGSYMFVLVALDNTGTGADGDYSQVTSVTDAGGNTYVKESEFSNTQGAAAGGATISLWKSQLTTGLSAGNSVTANHGSITARAIGILNVTVGAGNTLGAAGTIQTRADDGADPGSLAILGLPGAQHFFIRGTAYESAILTLTKTASFDQSNGAATSGGGGATNMGVAFEWLVATNTGATSDIGLSSTSDNASVLAGYVEVTGSTTVNPSTGHLTLSGKTPTVVTNFNVSPSLGHITLGGKVSTVTVGTSVTPVKGSIVFTGKQPSLSLNIGVSPSVGHLTLGGKVSTVTRTTAVSPTVGHVVLTGKTVTVVLGVNVAPVVGHLMLGGKVPSVTYTFRVSPSAGHIILGGKVPTVTISSGLTPSTGHLAYAGKVPLITTTLNPATGHIAYAGYIPSLGLEIGSITGHLALGGHLPTITYGSGALGHIKVDLGSFVVKPVKVWNGIAWVQKPLKWWTGTAWQATGY